MTRDERAGITPSRCPTCKHMLDAATHPDDATKQPRPGDLSVCISCGELLRFTDEMTVARLTAPELDQLERDDPEGFANLWRYSNHVLSMRHNLA